MRPPSFATSASRKPTWECSGWCSCFLVGPGKSLGPARTEQDPRARLVKLGLSETSTGLLGSVREENVLKREFLGYPRSDGTVGTRNHLLVIPSVVCANHVAARIAAEVGAVAIPHGYGCGLLGADKEQVFRTLVGMGKNPNVGAVLVVGLGCEAIQPRKVAEAISESQKPVRVVVIQEAGGTLKAMEQGTRIARDLVAELSMQERRPAGLEKLVLAVECGGSDSTSGLAANPAVGVASDILVRAGGTSILSETTEFIGAEHILAARALDEETGRKLVRFVKRMEDCALQMGVDFRGSQPSPGNIEGGLTTIEEKSLGCIYKAGSSPVAEVIAYAERPTKRGLIIMDTPGHDVESISGMLAGGAQVVVFTTGRGSPVGSPVAPVIKVTANPVTARSMADNIDIDLSAIIEGSRVLEEGGKEVFEEVLRVASGKKTKAEALGHVEFGITRIGPTV